MNYSRQMMDDARQSWGQPAIYAPAQERSHFLGKVYATFTAGLLVAGLSCMVVLGNPALLQGVAGLMSNFLLYILLIVGLVFGVQAAARVPGLNIIVYGLFTAAFGAITAPLVAYAVIAAGPQVVGQALGLTVLIFGGLSIWALTTKEDLSRWGTFLFIGCLTLFGIGLVGMFTAFNTGLWYSALWVALLGGYVMYDTQMIQRKYSTDMWIPAAVALFTDFIIMFWHILRLLSDRR